MRRGKIAMDDTATVGDRVRVAYDLIAPAYAVRNAAMLLILAGLAERLLKRAGSGAPILDVGCGAGRDMAWLESRGADALGVDTSAGMLAEARPRVRGALLQMDMRTLAFADKSFEGVWCVASLLHLPKADAPRALREFHRVLAPGGTIVLSLQEGAGEDWETDPYGKGTERFFARYSLGDATALLTETGFTVIERGSEVAGTRHWLFFLATAGGEEEQPRNMAVDEVDGDVVSRGHGRLSPRSALG